MATYCGTLDGVSVDRAKENAGNCSPRYIVHFTSFLTDEENRSTGVLDGYALAHTKAKKAGFRKYKAREFGGGFIISTFENWQEVARRVLAVL
jgi:hypothetical protein